DVTVQNEVATAFDRLEKELHSQLLGHARAALYHLGLLSVLFQRQFETAPLAEANSHGHSAAARLVAAFTGQIERDFHTDMGVANYASLLGVTPTHLTRCCNETSGRTALALLNDRKLFEARIRLRGTDMPVRKIAQMLGYSSAAYFTRAFQAGAGMTPTQFRRKGPLPIL
ncbi:MAG: helix-turn-helix transcriptional regulator, partial [Rhodobacteraceae bacterium]|nr:helix-turn-helix transcriptional regulator [Paracoccaceae bacterium]